jgi:Kef-type K+ transport system membrane component KefB
MARLSHPNVLAVHDVGTVILIAAKLGGELFERLKQPAVLGELVIGIVIGNLALTGWAAAEPLKANAIIAALAEVGVIILLFEVGLESNLGEMLEVGWSSLFVAAAGVVAPFLLGWGVAAYFLPEESRLAHFFVGATLCATSVGITARVLRDMNRLKTRESRIILGAAVIDDVLGLVILAVVAGAIRAAAAGAALSLSDVAVITGKAIAFLAQNEEGVNGVFVQDFVPGVDTTKTRRPLGGFDRERATESFGIAPDGKTLTVAGWEQLFSLFSIEGLPLKKENV